MEQSKKNEKLKELIVLNELIIFCKKVKAFLSEENIKDTKNYTANYSVRTFIDAEQDDFTTKSDSIVRELCAPLSLPEDIKYHVSKRELEEGYLSLYNAGENGFFVLNINNGSVEPEINL